MIRIKFWGVRGSTPTPQLENLRYGGNTSCLEMQLAGGQSLIFDAGSGLRNLGSALLKEANGASLDLKIFLTHFHWDHIQGIPFFAPIYGPANRVVFLSHHENGSIEEILQGQMARPYFPVDLAAVAARREFVELDSPVSFSGAKVWPFPLNHPQGAVGYRVECGNSVVVYATDLEHGHPKLDAVLRDHSANADLLIYDAQYTPEEYETHRNWGHSTWMEAIRVARDARVKQVVLFHHDPSHDDDFLDTVGEAAGAEFTEVSPAKEGSVIEIGQ